MMVGAAAQAPRGSPPRRAIMGSCRRRGRVDRLGGMKSWIIGVVGIGVGLFVGACGVKPEEAAGAISKTKIESVKVAPKAELKAGVKPIGGVIAAQDGKGDGSGGDPGGGNCKDGYVPCGTGPCCHSATERCGDGQCHPREGSDPSAGDGGGTTAAEVMGMGTR